MQKSTTKFTALVIGATGLIGKHLVTQLVNNDNCKSIKTFVRRPSNDTNPKIEEHIIDFNNLNSYKDKISGDVFFSCMGTTMKKAGSKEAQYLVDYTYQYNFAEIASENGVNDYVLVSSSGANSKSRIFYTKIKGELDNAICKLPFSRITIFRPSLLLGDRNEKRMGESIGSIIQKLIVHIPYLKKYRGIEGEIVAKAMISNYMNASKKSPVFYELDSIFDIG